MHIKSSESHNEQSLKYKINIQEFLKLTLFSNPIWQVLEEKISTLPWLANKKQEIEEAKPAETFREPAFKPYVSGKALITVLTAYMYLKWEERQISVLYIEYNYCV